MIDVSVIMLSYNQGNYIEDSIKSILNQKFDGQIELIIADDNSSDQSESIILEIIKNHPNGHWINYFRNMPNLGMAQNYKKAMSMAKGRYLAYCEGDDYWTDVLKTQKQFDFLEQNQNYNICVSRYQIYFENNKKFVNSSELFPIDKKLSLKNYLAFNFGHTTTFFTRNNFELPIWVDNWLFSVDQCLIIYAAKDKKIKYFDDSFTVYRMHTKNQTSNQNGSIASERNLLFLDNVNKDFQYQYDKLIKNRKKLNELFWNMIASKSILIKFWWKFRYIFQRWYGINVIANK